MGASSTSSSRCTRISAVAVMPGRSFIARFSAVMIAAYVTTFCSTTGFSLTCFTTPVNTSPGYASTVNVTGWPASIWPRSDSSIFALTCICDRSAAISKSVGA